MARQCLLDRSDLSIVSENDHRVGLCLCKYCSCGLHKCAYVSRRKASVPLVTSYQTSYRGKQAGKRENRQRDLYAPNPHKMDLETTNQREYRPFAVEYKSNESQRPEASSVHFTARSSYAAEYPNWGAIDAVQEHSPKYPVRGSEVRFQGSSTYKRTFNRPDSAVSARTRSSQSRSTLLFSGYEGVDQSTAQRTYIPPSSIHMSATVHRPKEEYVQVAASPYHFTSKSRTDFKPPSAGLLDPHLVRKNISMYLA